MRSVGGVKGGRYSVDVEFAAQVEPGKTMGRNVSKLENYLPKGATVRLVKADPDKSVVEVEVCLSAANPATALRDVSRAIELVAVTPAGVPADDRIGDLLQAKVTRVGMTRHTAGPRLTTWCTIAEVDS